MVSQEDIERLRELLARPAQNIVIVSHTNPDGDAVGSSLAWREALLEMGHRVTCIVPNKYPYFLDWMTGIENLVLFKTDEAGVAPPCGGGVGPDLFPGFQRCIPSGGVERGDRIQYDGQANPDRPPSVAGTRFRSDVFLYRFVEHLFPDLSDPRKDAGHAGDYAEYGRVVIRGYDDRYGELFVFVPYAGVVPGRCGAGRNGYRHSHDPQQCL